MSVGEELPCKKEHHHRACTQEISSCLLAISVEKRYNPLHRYWNTALFTSRRFGSGLHTAGRYQTPPIIMCTIDCNDIMTKYWRNLIWRCVHNPPNLQIKFPAMAQAHPNKRSTLELFVYRDCLSARGGGTRSVRTWYN